MIGAVGDIDRERARHELRLRLIELCEIGLRIIRSWSGLRRPGLRP
jgi:hypothetical protein